MPSYSPLAHDALDDLIQLIPGYDPVATAKDGMWFDYDEANRVLEFFATCLTHQKGDLAGELIDLMDWQKAVIANTFGWKNAAGYRRYRQVWYYVPRKNAKTTIAAGFPLWGLFCDGEKGAELYCAAADRDQALLLYNVSVGMIAHCPLMADNSQIYHSTKTVLVEDNGLRSTFKAVSSDAHTKHGYNTHMGIVDEVHAHIAGGELIEVLETSTGSRKQPLFILLTTADYDRPSVCNDKLRYALKVRDGEIDDPSFLPVIYRAEVEDDWHDEEIWKKANPGLGVTISEEYFRSAYNKALVQPSFVNTFKRLHLNMTTAQDIRWIGAADWKECEGPLSYEELAIDVLGDHCYGGIDLSSRLDISSLVLWFPQTGALLSWHWCPEEVAKKIDREKKEAAPYLAWAAMGYLTLTSGDVIDYDFIKLQVEDLGKIYDIRGIGIDRWCGTQLTIQLQGMGFDMIPFGQGYGSMTDPAKDFEAKVISKELLHGGHPVMRWMASNVQIEMDASGNIKPSKGKSPQKIDGIVSAIMAIGVSNLADPIQSKITGLTVI